MEALGLPERFQLRALGKHSLIQMEFSTPLVSIQQLPRHLQTESLGRLEQCHRRLLGIGLLQARRIYL